MSTICSLIYSFIPDTNNNFIWVLGPYIKVFATISFGIAFYLLQTCIKYAYNTYLHDIVCLNTQKETLKSLFMGPYTVYKRLKILKKEKTDVVS